MNLHDKSSGIAVLGTVLWAPELRNEFMNYIEKIQFHYHTIKDRNDVKLHFYTSNISLEKKWFDNEEYSVKFRNYGLEDLELGYRLEKRGLRVVYNPGAVVYHYHTYSFKQFCNRISSSTLTESSTGSQISPFITLRVLRKSLEIQKYNNSAGPFPGIEYRIPFTAVSAS